MHAGGGPERARRRARPWSAPLFAVAVVVAVAATAPPGPRTEPLSQVARVPYERRPAPSVAIAVSPQRAALLRDDGDGRVTFRFVDAANNEVASWSASRRAAPRLVCTACPDPVVADDRGYFRFSGGVWAAVDLDLPPSTLADPLAAGFGLVYDTAAARTIPVVRGAGGDYSAVADGGTSFGLRPTGLRPTIGGQVDFTGASSFAALPTVQVSEAGDGRWLSLQAPGFAQGDGVIVGLAGSAGLEREARLDTPGRRDWRVAPCAGTSRDASRALLYSTTPADSSGNPLPGGVARVRLVWLDEQLASAASVEVAGAYSACVVAPDGTATLWTSAVAGSGDVDVAVVDRQQVRRAETVRVGDATLVRTVLDPAAPAPALRAWPLGAPAATIDADLRVTPGEGIGGDVLLTDAAGGTWVTYTALDVTVRYGGGDR